MFQLNPNLAVYLHREPIDFRKNINGLAALVEHDLALDPFAAAVYVFGNRRRDRVKILGWSRNGFWLLQKRLERERFIWPRDNQRVMELTVQQLHWLLDGIDLAANGIDSYRYLRALFIALPNAKTVDDYEDLLPWRIALPPQ
jgi:transposase